MIRVENLSKSFGGIKAMDNVTAEIQNSSIFGLIVPTVPANLL